jgi:hypothetical protein
MRGGNVGNTGMVRRLPAPRSMCGTSAQSLHRRVPHVLTSGRHWPCRCRSTSSCLRAGPRRSLLPLMQRSALSRGRGPRRSARRRSAASTLAASWAPRLGLANWAALRARHRSRHRCARPAVPAENHRHPSHPTPGHKRSHTALMGTHLHRRTCTASLCRRN